MGLLRNLWKGFEDINNLGRALTGGDPRNANPKDAWDKYGSDDAKDPLRLFTAPDLPEPEPAPLAPTMSDPEVDEAQRKEREAQLRARGRASTIATSGQGDTSRPSLARRVLLGA